MSTDTYTYFKKWRLDREAGKGPRMVPCGPATEHVRSLLAAGVSQRSIAGAAGISPDIISRLLNHPRPTMQMGTERRILAVTLADTVNRRNARDFVMALGARRRIQALLALGWTHKHITEHMTGVGQISHVALHQRGNWIARATHDAVVAAYEALSMTPGPSSLTRRRAAASGYAPPLAWDEGALDNPEATPDLGRAEHGVDLDDWLHLVRGGVRPGEAAERFGVGLSAVERAAYRHERADVLGALNIERRAA